MIIMVADHRFNQRQPTITVIKTERKKKSEYSFTNNDEPDGVYRYHNKYSLPSVLCLHEEEG